MREQEEKRQRRLAAVEERRKQPKTPKPSLAVISPDQKKLEVQKTILRSTPKDLWDEDLKKMLFAHGFYAKYKKETKSFQNDFVDNGDGTVTDRATGLMWEKEGSPSRLFWRDVKEYVTDSNQNRHLGFSDWRIPTIEELASLIQPKKNETALHLSRIFGNKQKLCWSADWKSIIPGGKSRFYGVEFKSGKIAIMNGSTNLHFMDNCFLKMVRTIN